MQLTRSYLQQKDRYALKIEPGEEVTILFDPDGVNAPVIARSTTSAFTIGTLNLPNGDMVLSISFESELLHTVSFTDGGPVSLAACRGMGAKRSEFVVHDAMPRMKLILEKTDLQTLLKPAPSEEPSDG
jgi:hypothetical protein